METFEQALALKELGFDEECCGYYDDNILYIYEIENKNLCNGAIVCPLKQQVFRWFREKYKLVHEIQFGDGKIWIRYGYNSYVRALELDNNNNEFFHTYEEAENACIDKLIELAKNK